jgi:hypothetical protein
VNTDFKLQSFAFNPAFSKVGQKPLTQTPSVIADDKSNQQTESVTLSTPLKTPRPGSDMAQMMEDLQNNGVLPQAETVSPQVQKKPLREPNSDYMSMMVDSVQNDKTLGSGSVQVAVNSNGSIALLDDSQFIPGLVQPTTPPPQEQKSVPVDHGHQQAHGHNQHSLKEDGLLGGHMATEIVEKIGHGAHEAASHGAGHVTTEAVGHGAAKIAAHGSNAAHHAVEVAQHGVETVSETANATTAGMNTLAENAHHLSAGLEIALGVGTLGAGILAVPLTINGVKELKHGIKEKDTEKILEGIGGIAVGTRSASTAVVLGGMMTTSEVVGQIAGMAAQTLTPLGVLHGTVDAVTGGMDVYHGKTTKGLIKIGTGVAIGAAAVIGGLPLTLVALGMLGVKVGHKIYTSIEEKKVAELAAQQQQTPNLDATSQHSATVEVKS